MMNENLFQEHNPNTVSVIKSLLHNSVNGAIFVLNMQGIILGTSKGVVNQYGYAEEDILGKHFRCLFTEEDRADNKPEREIALVIESGNASDMNYIVHKDGSHIWTEGEALYVKDDQGLGFIVKNVHALQAQKKLEHQLKKTNNQLQRINKDLDTFVYTASHDLRAPLNTLEGLTSLLENELKEETRKDDYELFNYITMMQIALAKFKATLNDLSVIGKVFETDLPDVLPVVFSEMTDQVLFDLQEQIQTSDAIIRKNFDDAPEIQFSRKNIRSILYNLISNAIKYKSPDRVPEIVISTERMDEFVRLTVSDNGLGIEEKDQEEVFSLFKRFHNHVDGTGVGMGIIKRIMDNAGGNIELDSIPGGGSVFRLYFPFDQQ